MACHSQQHEREVERWQYPRSAPPPAFSVKPWTSLLPMIVAIPRRPVAAANELIADGVEVVIGHNCRRGDSGFLGRIGFDKKGERLGLAAPRVVCLAE
jgi:hypothetical protein